MRYKIVQNQRKKWTYIGVFNTYTCGSSDSRHTTMKLKLWEQYTHLFKSTSIQRSVASFTGILIVIVWRYTLEGITSKNHKMILFNTGIHVRSPGRQAPGTQSYIFLHTGIRWQTSDKIITSTFQLIATLQGLRIWFSKQHNIYIKMQLSQKGI